MESKAAAAASNGTTTPDFQCPELTLEDYDILDRLDWWSGVATLHISVGGLFLNTLLILVIAKMPELRGHSFNLMLVFLMISDNMYLAIKVANTLRKPFGILEHLFTQMFPYFLYPAQFFTLSCSVWTEVSITLERFVTAHTPLK